MTDTIADFLAHCSDLIPEYWRDRLAAALDDDPMTDTNRDAHTVSAISDEAVNAALDAFALRGREQCPLDNQENGHRGTHAQIGHYASDRLAMRHAIETILPHLAQPTDEAERWEPIDGDTKCQRCHQVNVCWFADSTLWNQIMRGQNGVDEFDIVCLRCFGELCEARLPAPVLHVSLEPLAQSSGRGADHAGDLARAWDEGHDAADCGCGHSIVAHPSDNYRHCVRERYCGCAGYEPARNPYRADEATR